MVKEHAPWRDKESLRQKYVDESKSSREIAAEWDTGKTTILRALRKFDIERRDCGHPPNNPDRPWQDASKCRELYEEQRLGIEEIAERWETDAKNILKWFDEHEIERRSVGGFSKTAEWKTEAYLQREYVENGRTIQDIANEVGCHLANIYYWMDKHGVETRPQGHHVKKYPPGHRFKGGQYSIVRAKVDGTQYEVPIHRLVAVAHGMLDPSEFRDSNLVVHHKNKIKWDNRPENLEVMTAREHNRLHAHELNQEGVPGFTPLAYQ